MSILTQIKELIGLVEANQKLELLEAKRERSSKRLEHVVNETVEIANQLADSLSNMDLVRNKAIKDTGLLDDDTDEIFDNLTKLIRKSLNSEISLIDLVDDRRQIIISKSGVGDDKPAFTRSREWPLTASFCRFVVNSGETLMVNDARVHDITKDEDITKQGLALSYLGMPIRTDDNICIGAVCAINSTPNFWTTRDIEVLEEVTTLVNRLVSLHTALNKS